MDVEQIVEVPATRRLIVDVPREIPAGRTILTFTPAPDETRSDARDDDVTSRLNRYYAGRSPESDSGVQQAAYRLFAQEDW